MQAMVYTPAMQGTGEFDGGKIKERKPIGFSGEGSVIKRVGPLFYWAWASTSEEAHIGLHPHQAFEIMTYVIEGRSHHGDTLGTSSTVGAGGAQVMQTGSGVSHQEHLGAGTEMFQIWFEPEYLEAVKRRPTYRQYEHEEFPEVVDEAGNRVKTVIGDGAPVELVAKVRMWDVEIPAGAVYRHRVAEGDALTAVAVQGQGTWGESGSERPPAVFHHKDFIVATAISDSEAEIANAGDAPLRLVLIQVPTAPGYPLVRKR